MGSYNNNEAMYRFKGIVAESSTGLLPPPNSQNNSVAAAAVPLASRYSSEILRGTPADTPFGNETRRWSHQDGGLRNCDNVSCDPLGNPMGLDRQRDYSFSSGGRMSSQGNYRAPGDVTEGYVPQYVVPTPPRFDTTPGNVEGEMYARTRGYREPVRIARQLSPPGTQVPLFSRAPKRLKKDAALEDLPLFGMIFGCTTETYQECIRLQLFGLPSSNIALVRRVIPGSKLFLYNFREKELSGIFEATSCGDRDLVPNAFRRWGSYPAQVKIRCLEKCPNLPISAFKEAIHENFYDKGKFKYGLNEVQVHRLIQLFRQESEYWQREKGAIATGQVTAKFPTRS